MSLTKLYKKAGVKFWLQFPFNGKNWLMLNKKVCLRFNIVVKIINNGNFQHLYVEEHSMATLINIKSRKLQKRLASNAFECLYYCNVAETIIQQRKWWRKMMTKNTRWIIISKNVINPSYTCFQINMCS